MAWLTRLLPVSVWADSLMTITTTMFYCRNKYGVYYCTRSWMVHIVSNVSAMADDTVGTCSATTFACSMAFSIK